MHLSDPGSWGGGTRRSGFVGHPEINDEIKAIRLSATRKFEGFAERRQLRRELCRPHQGEGSVPEPAVPAGQRLARRRAGGIPHGRRERRVLRPPERRHRLRRDRPVRTAASGSRSTRSIDPNASAWRSRLRRDERLDGEREAHHGLREVRHRHASSARCRCAATSACRASPRTRIGAASVSSTATPAGVPVLDVTYRNEGAKYTDILPSLNLALELPHDHEGALRRGHHHGSSAHGRDGRRHGLHRDAGHRHTAARAERRVLYWQRNGGGNPKLKPWKANTFDLSWEKYFGENQGYVSLAAYYKNLTTYIVNGDVPVRLHGIRAAAPRATTTHGERQPLRRGDAAR